MLQSTDPGKLDILILNLTTCSPDSTQRIDNLIKYFLLKRI